MAKSSNKTPWRVFMRPNVCIYHFTEGIMGQNRRRITSSAGTRAARTRRMGLNDWDQGVHHNEK
jgi:hypothetical protein